MLDNDEIELVFDDNHLAIQLFGEYDQNLAMLEKQLDVKTSLIGNHIIIKGNETKIKQAQQVLEELYERLGQGDEISTIDVKALSNLAKENHKNDSLTQFYSLDKIGKKSHVKMAKIAQKTNYSCSHPSTRFLYSRPITK